MEDFRGAVKVDDTPLAYFFTARWANWLLPWAVEKGISPNQITAASLALSVLVGLCFANGSRLVALLGSVILIISFTLDCLDGQLARYTGNSTPFGEWFDVFGDRVRELGLWVCLCVGHSVRTGNLDVWMWGMLGAIALCLRFAEGLYRERALDQPRLKPMTAADNKKVFARVWVQRFFYFNIAERTFFLALAAPLDLAVIFFKVVAVGCVTMMVAFSIQGWYRERANAFTVKSGEE